MNACFNAYNEPLILKKYFQNMPFKSKRIFRSNFLGEHPKPTRHEIIDTIVDNIHTVSKKNKNWIIFNAPLDFSLIKKLIGVNLHPIQLILFHDTDPAHKVLLKGEGGYRTEMIREVIENVKNGLRYGTAVTERIAEFAEFVGKIEKESNTFDDDECGNVENESEIEDLDENAEQTSHKRLLKTIVPEIIDRLDRYTEDLLKKWFALKERVSEETDHFINPSIIECKSNSTTNVIEILIEDTLYHMKK